MRPLLITGGAGFIGSNLADRLATEGENVLIYDSLARPGVELNLDWLRKRHPRRIAVVIADVRNTADVRDAVCDAAGVFHLAAQVAVTTSLQDPREDFEVNLLGTLNVLEALRHSRVPCVFASTNKVYGDVGGLGLVLAGNAYAPRIHHFSTGWTNNSRLTCARHTAARRARRINTCWIIRDILASQRSCCE